MPMFESHDSQPEDFQPGIAAGPLQPLPLLLLLDVSSSMKGQPIDELNRALVDGSTTSSETSSCNDTARSPSSPSADGRPR